MRASLVRVAGVHPSRRRGRGAGAGSCGARPPPPRAPAPCSPSEASPGGRSALSLTPRGRIKSLLREADGWGGGRGGARTPAPPSPAAPGGRDGAPRPFSGSCKILRGGGGGNLSPRPLFGFFFLNSLNLVCSRDEWRGAGGGRSAAIACPGTSRPAAAEARRAAPRNPRLPRKGAAAVPVSAGGPRGRGRASALAAGRTPR